MKKIVKRKIYIFLVNINASLIGKYNRVVKYHEKIPLCAMFPSTMVNIL